MEKHNRVDDIIIKHEREGDMVLNALSLAVNAHHIFEEVGVECAEAYLDCLKLGEAKPPLRAPQSQLPRTRFAPLSLRQ